MTFKEDMERMMGIRKGTIRPWEEGMKRALNMESEPETKAVKEAISEPIKKAGEGEEFQSYEKWKRGFLKRLKEEAIQRGEAPPDYLRGAFQGYIRPALLNTYIDRNGNIGQERPKGRDETNAPRAPQSESGLKWYNFGWRPGKFYLKGDGTQTASRSDLTEADLDPRTGLPMTADVAYILSSADKENIIKDRADSFYNQGMNLMHQEFDHPDGASELFNDLRDMVRKIQMTHPNASISEIHELADEFVRSDAPIEHRVMWGMIKDRLPNDMTRMLLDEGESADLMGRMADSFGDANLRSKMYEQIHMDDAGRHEEWKGEELRNKRLASQLAEYMVTRALAGDAPAFLSPKVQRNYVGEDGQEYSNYPVTRMMDDAFDHAQRMVRSLYYDEKGNLRVDEDGTPLFETMTPEQVISGYQKLLNKKEGQLNRAKTMDRRQNEQMISELLEKVDDDVESQLMAYVTKKLRDKVVEIQKGNPQLAGKAGEVWNQVIQEFKEGDDSPLNETGIGLAKLNTKLRNKYDPNGKTSEKLRQARIKQIQDSMNLTDGTPDRGWNQMRGTEQGQSALGNYLSKLTDDQLTGFFDAVRSGETNATGLLSRLGLDGVPDDDEVTSPKLMEALERADQLSKVSAWESQQADRDLRRRMELSGVKTSDNVPSWEEMYDEEFLNGLNSPITNYQKAIFSAVPELRAKLSEPLVEQAKADGTFNPKKPPKAGLGEVLANLSPEDAGKLDKANSFLQGVSTGSDLPLIVKNAQGVDILNPDLLDKYRAQSKIRDERVNYDPIKRRATQEKNLKNILDYINGNSDALRGTKPKRIDDQTLSILHPDFHAAANQYNALVDTWVDDSKDGDEDGESIKLIGNPYHGNNPFMEKIPERDLKRAYNYGSNVRVPFGPSAQEVARQTTLNGNKSPVNAGDTVNYKGKTIHRNNLYNLAGAALNMGAREFMSAGPEVYHHYMSKADPNYKDLEESMRATRAEIEKVKSEGDPDNRLKILESKMDYDKKMHDKIILRAKGFFENDRAPLEIQREQYLDHPEEVTDDTINQITGQSGNFLLESLHQDYKDGKPSVNGYFPEESPSKVWSADTTPGMSSHYYPQDAENKVTGGDGAANKPNLSSSAQRQLNQIERQGFEGLSSGASASGPGKGVSPRLTDTENLIADYKEAYDPSKFVEEPVNRAAEKEKTFPVTLSMPTLREMMGMFAVQKEGHPYGQPMFGDIAPLPGEKPLQGDDAEKE